MKFIKSYYINFLILHLFSNLPSLLKAEVPAPYEAKFDVVLLFKADSKSDDSLFETMSKGEFHIPFELEWKEHIGSANLKITSEKFSLNHESLSSTSHTLLSSRKSQNQKINSIDDLISALCIDNSIENLLERRKPSLVLWICQPLSRIEFTGKWGVGQAAKVYITSEKTSRTTFVDVIHSQNRVLTSKVVKIIQGVHTTISENPKNSGQIDAILFPSLFLSNGIFNFNSPSPRTVYIFNGLFSNDFIPAFMMRSWKLVNIPFEDGKYTFQRIDQYHFDYDGVGDNSIGYDRYAPNSFTVEIFSDGMYEGQLYTMNFCFSFEETTNKLSGSSSTCIEYIRQLKDPKKNTHQRASYKPTLCIEGLEKNQEPKALHGIHFIP